MSEKDEIGFERTNALPPDDCETCDTDPGKLELEFLRAMQMLQFPQLSYEEIYSWMNHALQFANGNAKRILALRSLLSKNGKSNEEIAHVDVLLDAGLVVPSVSTNAIFAWRNGHWVTFSG